MLTKRGTVTKAVLRGTVTVTVHRSKMHGKYQKRFRVSKKFLVDAAGQDVAEGDEVEIGECRPISRRKHFKVLAVLKKAPAESRMKVAEDEELKNAVEGPRRTKKPSPQQQ